MNIVTKYFESIPRHERERAVSIISIAAATALLYSSYRWISSSPKPKQQNSKEIPEPDSSYPYFGHMLSLGATPSKTVYEWHKKLGPIIKLRMGVRTWILINDPELAHKLLVTNGAETSYRPNTMFAYYYHSMEGKGLVFAEPGASFRKNRSAALAVLAPNLIAAKYMNSIRNEAQDMVDRLIAATEAESVINPIKYLEMNSLNVLFSACFGRTFQSVDDPEFKKLSAIVEETMKMAGLDNDLANFLPIVHIFDFFAGTQAKMKHFVYKKRNPMFRELIKKAVDCVGPNVVKSLVENGVDFDDDETLVFMADLLIAGTDTISVSLQWNFAIMCHYPKVQKMVCVEIDEFIKAHGRIPEFTDRDHIPYCISVMKECMRFKPTTPFGAPRSVKEDLEVDGYIIPKDSTIAISMFSMHKQSSIYPTPEKFIPERFIDNQKTMQSAANGKLSERDHYNFGFGRRICPGAYLAEVEIFYAFIQVFARCTIEPANELPNIENIKFEGATSNPYPYKVKFVKRQDALVV